MPVEKSSTRFSFMTGNSSDFGCKPGSAFTRRLLEKVSVTKTVTATPFRGSPYREMIRSYPESSPFPSPHRFQKSSPKVGAGSAGDADRAIEAEKNANVNARSAQKVTASDRVGFMTCLAAHFIGRKNRGGKISPR